MVYVFSFTIYGNDKKYTHGLLENLRLIQQSYPSWQVWIYYGSDVEGSMLSRYRSYSNAVLYPVTDTGAISKCYRYFPIDDLSVDVCIIRDADSRVNERDRRCIDAFLQSERLFHIIRDHPNHYHKIMAGMWGIKKGALNESIYDIFIEWKKHNVFDFWSDTRFLVDCIYPKVYSNALIHSDILHFHDGEIPIPHQRDGNHFIGQVYEYNEHDEEYPKFSYGVV
jgi:hypothetical protein